jgi:dTDP-4-amino-4,6-dideoxygalactose transaminase
MTPIFVTKPSLPPLDEYVEFLREIWDRQWLTNGGHFHEELEHALARYLGVPYVSLFCNGTVALRVGLEALGISGEVITTPYSFPATAHVLGWGQCTPVFCDVDPATGNLDPGRVEALITPRTRAILPVHVYGTPCDLVGLESVATRHDLKLFYDAAHAFGVTAGGASILNAGDLSMLSFHATKVFNTAEGGALVTSDPKLKQRVDLLKNFGFVDEVTVTEPGINGKMNELQAALGLAQLRHIDEALAQRREVAGLYRRELAGVQGLRLLSEPEGVRGNCGYFPIFVDEAVYPMSRDALYRALRHEGYLVRRYFYPLISEFEMYRHLPSAANLPVATRLSREVICLPIYPGLSSDHVSRICELICAPATKVAD